VNDCTTKRGKARIIFRAWIAFNVSSRQSCVQDNIGSLKVGKYADLVVLDNNPFDVDPMKLSEINVLKTMMNGKFTNEAGSEGPKHEEKNRTYPGDFERQPTTY